MLMTSTIKNRKGFAIVSVLVASAIGLIVLAGTTRIITFSLNSSQAAKSSATELELLLSLSKLLSDETQCKGNLKPNRVLNSIISGIDSSHPLTIIEEGQSFKNNLEIVKIDLMGTAGNPKTEIVNRKFVVYYNKKSMSTLNNKPCDTNSVEGCHFYSCDLKYKIEDVGTNPNIEVCDIQNCSSIQSNSIVGISCGDGQFLKGFDDSGNKICHDLTEVYSEIGSCATGEYLSGFDNNGQKICSVLTSANTPPPQNNPPQCSPDFTWSSQCSKCYLCSNGTMFSTLTCSCESCAVTGGTYSIAWNACNISCPSDTSASVSWKGGSCYSCQCNKNVQMKLILQ